MKIFIFIFLTISIFARTNPFVPTQSTERVTSNKEDETEFFSKEQIFLPSTSRVLKKIIIVHQNMDGSIEEVSKDIDKRVDWHEPIEVFQKESDEAKRKYSYKFKKISIKDIDFINFELSKKALLVNTQDEITRQFTLTDPYRIVIDFKKDIRFFKKSLELKDSFFTKIAIGNHDKYYRVIIYLDSFYDYKIEKREKGYLIELNQ